MLLRKADREVTELAQTAQEVERSFVVLIDLADPLGRRFLLEEFP
jgi:hypothetical protein